MSLSVLLVALMLTGVPWSSDIGGYLERSSEAEFAGEHLVLCSTPDGDRSAVFNLAQVDDRVVAWGGGDDGSIVTMAPGQSATMTDGEVEVTVVETTEPEADSDLYEVDDTTPITYLGRPATEVTLLREDALRVALTVDDESGAVLRTSTYDGDGDLYCDRRQLTFETGSFSVPEVEDTVAAEAAQPAEAPAGVSDSIAGFELLDTYAFDEGTMSYFSDGFFSVGVVVTDRPLDLGQSEESSQIVTSTGVYHRTFQAGNVSVGWTSRGMNMAVIGDLPPDLLEDFLSGLPLPTDEGFLGRIWNRLFG